MQNYQDKQPLKFFIENRIKSISVLKALQFDKDVEKEIQNITESILTKSEDFFLKKDNMNYNNFSIEKSLIIDDDINTLEKYNQLIKNINVYIDLKEKCCKYLEQLKIMGEYLKEMKNFGIIFNDNDYSEQIKWIMLYKEVNDQQLETHVDILNKLHNNAEKFSICILFDYNLNIWLNKRIDPNKDFHGYYQVCGGKLELYETYERCAIRETEEEAGINITDEQKLIFICFDEYFSIYKNRFFKCGIFAYYTNEIPVNNEPMKQNN